MIQALARFPQLQQASSFSFAISSSSAYDDESCSSRMGLYTVTARKSGRGFGPFVQMRGLVHTMLILLLI